MNKKYIISGIMLLALTATLVSCKARSEYGKIYIAGENESYVLKTDVNGDTVVNAEGNLIKLKMRNAKEPHHDTDGNAITEVLEYPQFIDEGKKIDCKYYKIKIPSGWKNTGTVGMSMGNEKLDASINFSNDTDKTYDEIMADAALFAEEAKKNGTEVEQGKAKILNTDCDYYTIIGKDNDSVLTTYFLNHNDHTFRFVCSYKKDNLGKIDFTEVLNGIEFK